MSPIDIMKKQNDIWNIMTEADKKPYVLVSIQDQARFDQEVMQLRTNGFFISRDGVKSTDMTKKVKILDKRAI